MNQAVVEAISQIIREKDIDRETFQEIIESIFLKAIEKKYGQSENFSVIFNIDKGDIEIYAEKEVVPDGEVCFCGTDDCCRNRLDDQLHRCEG